MTGTTILGIDPGSRFTGFGVVYLERDKAAYIDSGVISCHADHFPNRLKIIFDAVVNLLRQHPIDSMAIEQVFMHKNADSALKLGHARGAAIVAAVHEEIPVSEYSARQIKQSVVGTGKAEKSQVQHMIKIMLNQTKSFAMDESDALAVALCHGHTQAGLKQMQGVTGMVRSRYR